MNRVVVTGLGVVSPNGVGLVEFTDALKNSRSGIKFLPFLEKANFKCQVGGIPSIEEEVKKRYFTQREIVKLKNPGMVYGIMAGVDAWKDAGLKIIPKDEDQPDWDSGCFFGVGGTGMDMIRDAINTIDSGRVKKLGSRYVERIMNSGISAYLGGKIGLGNQVSTNSSACNTGTEAILMAYNRIKNGEAKRMLAGGCDGHGIYIWGGFDSMHALNSESNHEPGKASRPLSASAKGFIPGAGAGALVLESLESATKRGVRIYAEILGGFINSGGQRGSGTMTLPNSIGTETCIRQALINSNTLPSDISAISGHLTSTKGDPLEIDAWVNALERRGDKFPYINSLKSMIGHCMGGAGAIECVATVIQLFHNFFHGSLNCEDLHPYIAEKISYSRVPQKTINNSNFNIIAKSSFGFGDVNSCIIYKKWN